MRVELDDAAPVPLALSGAVPPAASVAVLDRDWLAVAATAIGLILSTATLALYTFGVFARPLMAEFRWSRTSVSIGLGCFQFGVAFASLLWGLATDRLGPRRTILFCVVALSCVVAAFSLLTPHLWHLYLLYLLIPVLGGAASPVGYSSVMVRLFEQKLGLALGLALMGVGLGAALLPPLAQAVVGAYGWRSAYLCLGAMTLVITLPAALIATRNVPGPVRGAATTSWAALGRMLRTRTYVRMTLAFVLLGIVSVGMLAHVFPMMVDVGLTPAAAARIVGLSGLAVVIGRGGLGWVLDRVHAPYVLAAVALVAAVVPLLLAFGQGPATGVIAAVMLGAVLGAEVDLISYLIRRYFDQAAYGRLYGIAFGLFSLGATIGPVMLASSFDRFGSYKAGLVVFAVFALVIAALALALPPYVRPHRMRTATLSPRALTPDR